MEYETSLLIWLDISGIPGQPSTLIRSTCCPLLKILTNPFQLASQDRFAYSGGIRFDYTQRLNPDHLIKAGIQIDRTQAVNKTRLSAFFRDGVGEPTGSVVSRNADNRTIGWREEFWIQDQWTPWDQWTFNIGVRFDQIQALTNDRQVSPRLGATYALTPNHVFRVFYGRLFTPPNLEAVRFAQLNTIGTTAEPENLTNRTVKPERAHYFEVGSSHALNEWVTLELTGFYKLSKNLSDAGQFGTTPLLNFFAFKEGWQRGVDFAVKAKFMDNLYGRANVAWGQCRGKKLQSGHFLLEQDEIDDINIGAGCFAIICSLLPVPPCSHTDRLPIPRLPDKCYSVQVFVPPSRGKKPIPAIAHPTRRIISPLTKSFPYGITTKWCWVLM